MPKIDEQRDDRPDRETRHEHVALYSGNIANKQGLETVIEAARQLAHRDDIVFVIAGEGPNRVALQKLAAGLGNVQFRDLQPAERMADFLSLASVHLLPQIVGAADLVLPSKLTNMGEIAAAARAHDAAKAGPLIGEIDGVCENCHLTFWYPEEKAFVEDFIRRGNSNNGEGQ